MAAFLCALAAVANVARFLGPGYELDDAWISFRVARTWIESGVLTYDATRPPVEGMTNLLWTLLSALWIGALPGVDPIHVARLLGVVCHVATVLLLFRAAAAHAERLGGSPLVAGVTAAGLAALSGSLAFHAQGGMETPLWGLLFVATLEALRAASDGKGGIALGVLLALLAWMRPEGIVLGAAGCAFLLHARLWAPARRALPMFAGAVLALEAFRWLTYGSLVPNTFYAKPPDPLAGLDYAAAISSSGRG